MIDYNDFIEDYIHGNLNEEDYNAFEKALLTDNNLAQNVAIQRLILESLKQYKLREKVKTNFNKIKHTSNKSSKVSIFRWSVILIGLLCVSSLCYWMWHNKMQQSLNIEIEKIIENNIDIKLKESTIDTTNTIEDSNKKPQIFADNTRPSKSNEIEPESHLRSIKNNKNSEGLILAQEFFEVSGNLQFDNPKDSIAFYKGVQSFKNNKFEEAGTFFLQVEDTSPIYGQCQWYYALTLLARERYDTFQIMVEEMASDNNFILQNKAIQILEKLKYFK